MSDPAGIRVAGLTKRFGATLALDAVDLEVAPGELFTLLGPSGCGKTTLLRTLAGFERPDAGTVHIGGRAMAGVPPQRRDVGLVFQSYALFPHLSVFENVAFGLRTRGVSGRAVQERVEATLATVRLSELAGRSPAQLSGGQQQRVGIARALACEPTLLLMDEPLSNLDARLRLTMRAEVRELQRSRGITTVYVTHDQEEALAISDRIAVLDAGRVQQVGTPHAIYADPANLFVASFVGQVNRVPGERLPAQAGHDPAAVLLAARPEELRLLGPDDASEDPSLEATVAGSAFLGSVARVALDAGAGLRLEVELHRPGARLLPTPGTQTRVAIPPAALLRFDARSGRRLREAP